MTVSIVEGKAALVKALAYASSDFYSRNAEIFDRCLLVTEHMWIGYYDQLAVCAWGLVPPTLLSDSAYLWMITLEVPEGAEFLLVRHSQIEIRKMLKMYPLIVGHCEIGAERSIRWLRWLGAKFGEPVKGALPFTIVGGA